MAPSTIGEKNVIFAFDNHSIPWQNNLKLSMVVPDKHMDNPLVRRGGKGKVDEWAVQYYGSIVYHDGKYKLWYIAADNQSLDLIKKGKGFSGLRPAYAESLDGIHWEKPNLGLVEHLGSKNNNLVRLEPGDIGGIHLLVIHDDHEENPDRQFKMMLTVAAHLPGGKGSTSITLFSPDGLNWKSATDVRFDNGFLLEEDLVLPPINFEQGGLYWKDGLYFLPGQVFSPTVTQPDGKIVGRVMTILRSPDLINWESSLSYSFIRNGMGGKDVPVGHGEEAHLAAAIWDRGNVQLGFYGLWHGAEDWQDRSMDLGMLISNDGVNYREPEPDYVLIPRGSEGKWDQGGLLQGQGFANVGEKTFVWYGSWDMTKPSYPPRGGVGLVTLRRDGFGFLSSKDSAQPAHFVTRLFDAQDVPSGQVKFFINATGASADAPIKVELLNYQGAPVPGYSGDNAALVAKSGLHQELLWNTDNKSGLVDVPQRFSIKVTFPENSDSKVYAIYFEDVD